MAPLAIRQNHSLVPSPPRPHKGPFTRPVEVTGHIDPVVFAKLFAGTVGIFIISILIWKSGNFIRSFTQHRILEEGRSPNTRYAKTWYGWVNVQTHEKNKQFFRNIFVKLKDWTAWKSTRTDYRWAWWDPGQEALEARRKQKERLKWLPRFLFSYEHPTADEIWNPVQLPECHGAVLEPAEPVAPDPVQVPERSKQPSEENVQPIPQKRFKTPSKEDRVAMLKPQVAHRHSNSKLSIASEDRLEDVIWSDARMYIQSSTLSHEKQESLTERDSVNTSINLKRDQFSKRRSSLEEDIVHLPQFDGPSTFRATRPRAPPSQSRKMRESQPVFFNRGNLRKYQAWSAMMQGESAKALLQELKDSSGPPGTPMMDILSSFASVNSVNELVSAAGKKKQRIGRQSRSSAEKMPFVAQRGVRGSRGQPLGSLNPNDMNGRSNTVPLRLKRIPTALGSLGDRQHSLRRRIIDRHTVHELLQPQEGNLMGHQDRQPVEGTRATFNELNDWEIRLLHKLDRKLVWLFNETTPGQKPYHFALLANHWLNRETWLVIDPISRVSTDARRIQGDPRFNVPYPEPDLRARPKYPAPMRTRIHPPRIDSWRAAVNRHRRLSGVRERVPPVELYLESAEEPPDGHIDTACWMLPKPPQGFEMSSKQKSAWYEGGAGWQETLEDWKLVKRGYRLRKGIFEGRVNRHRVMEIGRSVYGHSRRTLHKLSPKPAEVTPSTIPQHAVSCAS